MNIPKNLRYTESHEWARHETDGTIAIGITDHAQEQLGDIVFIEAPAVGRKVKKGDSVGVVESVKAASDIYAPLAGEVVAANTELAGSPEQVNENAHEAWIYRIKPDNPAELEQLLDAAAYEKIASAE